jgi:hypothetical protein
MLLTYKTPVLVVHGRVEEITANYSTGSEDPFVRDSMLQGGGGASGSPGRFVEASG